MHDTNLEERLRSVLRQEGDGLPFTITTDELERRLVLRRRERNGRRLSLMAAGLAAVAVGAIFALSNGWLTNAPLVGTDPSPSPAPNASVGPTESPVPSSTPDPTPTPRAADPVGEVGQAVLVTATGVDTQRPDAFEVTRLDPATGASLALATIPGSVIPDDGWLAGHEGPPQISATGFLAIPFTRGPNEDENGPAIAIIDIRVPDAEPWILDGYTSMSWDMSDKLVVERDGLVAVAWPMSRYLEPFAGRGAAVVISANGGGVAIGPAVTTEDATRFLASRDGTWGYVGFDGVFSATNDLPPVYQRTGRERPAGDGAHGLGEACDEAGEPVGGACYLIESNADHEPFATWLNMAGGAILHDFAWGADGASVWMLLHGGAAAAPENRTVALTFSAAIDQSIEVARIEVPREREPAILGFSEEVDTGSPAVVAIGDDDGLVWAFVLEDGQVVQQDGTARFAGWAGDSPPYDPD